MLVFEYLHKFFTNFFDKLAGNEQLRMQIISGIPENGIRESWEPALGNFKVIRKKYLLYPDFEVAEKKVK